MKSISFRTPLPPVLRTGFPYAPEAEGSVLCPRPAPCSGSSLCDLDSRLPRGRGDSRSRCAAGAGGVQAGGGAAPAQMSPPHAYRVRGRFSQLPDSRQTRVWGAPLTPSLRGLVGSGPPLRGGAGAAASGAAPRLAAGRSAPDTAGFPGTGCGRYLPSAAAGRGAGG